MKNRFFIIASTIILVAIGAIYSHAGEVRIYDANDQFIGISADRTNANEYTIFIPALNVYAFLKVTPTSAYLRNFCSDIYYDSSGFPYFLVPSTLCSACGTYYKSNSIVENVSVTAKVRYGGCSQEDYSDTRDLSPAIEVPVESFPFTFPITTPLRIEYYEPSSNMYSQDELDAAVADAKSNAGFYVIPVKVPCPE